MKFNDAEVTEMRLYGITKAHAQAKGICLKCKDGVVQSTAASALEYRRSGLCEDCVEAGSLEHAETSSPVSVCKKDDQPAWLFEAPRCYGSNPTENDRITRSCSSCSFQPECWIASGMPIEDRITRETFDKAVTVPVETEAIEERKPDADKTLAEVTDTFRALARPSADQILAEMADTFRERNKVYGDNYKRVGAVMAAMFPNGIQLIEEDEFNRWHLFELIIVKLTRFANSGLTHADSIHDAAVYCAMVESLTIDNAFPIHTTKERL